MTYALADPDLQSQITKVKNDPIIGFTVKKIKGLITFLPFHMESSLHTDELSDAVKELAEALDTHRKNLIFQPPSWINHVPLHEEEKIRNTITQLRDELDSKQNLLQQQLALKSILYLKHSQLVEGCMAIFDAMGMRTMKNEIGEEDFWILDKEKTNMIICECKGKDNNLTREDISMLDIHREARGKDENFPALLITNNFNKANSLAEKDMPVASNVIQHAVKLHVLVIRSLDLIGLLDLYQKNSISSKEIAGYFSKSVGWMKITEEKVKILSR